MSQIHALLRERHALVEDMRSRVERASARGGMRSDEKREIDRIDSEIGDLDGRIAEIRRSHTADGHPLGASLSGVGSDHLNHVDEGRSLGEWASTELRSIFESGSGGAIVPTGYLGRVWDRLAEKAVGLRSGFTVIPTDKAELSIPRITSDMSAAWVNEGDTIAESDPGLDAILATPRKLAALTSTSNETILDSNPKVLDVVFANLYRSLALGLDDAFFEGSGAAPPQLRGLKSTVGIQSVVMGANGAAFADLDPVAEAIGLLEGENAEATAIVMHPRTWADLMKLREQSGSLKPLLSESAKSPTGGVQRTLFGVPVYLAAQLSTTETKGTSGAVASSVYVYQADQVIAVRREEARIEVDRSVHFAKDMVAIRGIVRFDLAVPNPKAVCRIEGVLAS